MKVDNVLILAAGKGTRMGKIGKLVPKILWPIFDLKMIELQVEYCKTFNPDNIFINVFHEKELLLKNLSNLDATIVLEDSEIDTGGAVHNVSKRLNYKGSLMIVAGDQFISPVMSYFEELFKSFSIHGKAMMLRNFKKNEGYNEVSFEQGHFKGVRANSQLSEDKHFYTYTGMSIVDLALLKPKDGISKFFESVIVEGDRCGFAKIRSEDYWDFGTTNRYYHSMFRVVEIESANLFKRFLIDSKAIIESNLSSTSYKASSDFCINLSGYEYNLEKSIILKTPKKPILEESDKIIYSDLVELP